jgi:arylformamidase
LSFADLPALPPLIHPLATGYAARIMERSREVQAKLPAVLDVPYGDDYWQRLDLYLPPEEHGAKLPVLCFLHGGAWVNGCKEWLGFMAPALVSLPAIFIAVSYRHAPAAKFPAQAEDCASALAWVWRNVERHGGDRERIFLGGHSAGGHLAALVALRADLRRGLPDDVVKACFPVSAPFDLRGGSGEDPGRRQKIAGFLASDADRLAASPVAHTEGNRTPFLVAWGGEDFPELVPQAQEMVMALGRQPAPVEAMALPELSHFDTNERAGEAEFAWVRRVRAYLAGKVAAEPQPRLAWTRHPRRG